MGLLLSNMKNADPPTLGAHWVGFFCADSISIGHFCAEMLRLAKNGVNRGDLARPLSGPQRDAQKIKARGGRRGADKS